MGTSTKWNSRNTRSQMISKIPGAWLYPLKPNALFLCSVFSHPNIKPSNIVVDAVSMSLLKGSTIDFVTEMIGSTFRVVENPQSEGSGCGCGVSWELKL